EDRIHGATGESGGIHDLEAVSESATEGEEDDAGGVGDAGATRRHADIYRSLHRLAMLGWLLVAGCWLLVAERSEGSALRVTSHCTTKYFALDSKAARSDVEFDANTRDSHATAIANEFAIQATQRSRAHRD